MGPVRADARRVTAQIVLERLHGLRQLMLIAQPDETDIVALHEAGVDEAATIVQVAGLRRILAVVALRIEIVVRLKQRRDRIDGGMRVRRE